MSAVDDILSQVPPKKVKTTKVEQILEKPKDRGFLGTIADYGADAVQQVLAGPRRAYEGLAGLGGDIYNLEVAGANKLADVAGMPPAARRGMNDELQGQNWLPSSADVNAATSQFIGPTPEAKTGLGEVIGTGAEYATNPSRGFFRNVVMPTVGTEVGGYLGEKAGHETIGRLLGGGLGGISTSATERGIVGPQVSEERARLARLLADEGVDLTAGQVSGRKALRYAETGPYETKPANIKERQGRQFNRAALRQAGIDADEVTPDVLAQADTAFGNRYGNVVRNAGGIPLDSQLETDLLQNVMDYERLTGVGARPAVGSYFQRISDAAQQNGGTIPADIFQQISSEISRDLRKLRGNPQANAELMDTLREFRNSMFDSIGRNGNPNVVADWRILNRQYRNYKDIERAMYGPGEATAEGMISPAKLGTSVAAGDKAGALRERGDLTGQAKAGRLLMTDLPQSGTAARLLIPGTLAAMGHQIGAADLKGAAATAAGALAYPAVSSALTSRPVRTALIRQATDPLPMLDARTQLLSAMLSGGGGPR